MKTHSFFPVAAIALAVLAAGTSTYGISALVYSRLAPMHDGFSDILAWKTGTPATKVDILPGRIEVIGNRADRTATNTVAPARLRG